LQLVSVTSRLDTRLPRVVRPSNKSMFERDRVERRPEAVVSPLSVEGRFVFVIYELTPITLNSSLSSCSCLTLRSFGVKHCKFSCKSQRQSFHNLVRFEPNDLNITRMSQSITLHSKQFLVANLHASLFRRHAFLVPLSFVIRTIKTFWRLFFNLSSQT
jgi:hypothetical protein